MGKAIMANLKARIYVETSTTRGLSTSSKIAIGVGATVLGVAGAVVAAPFIIAGVGFGAGGVAAGSLAAAWQASIGNVVAGSLFATLQSAGAAGLGAAGLGVASVAGAAVGGTVGGIVASGVTKKIPVIKLEKTFDIYDMDQDGYVSASNLEEILKDLDINLSYSELRTRFRRATGIPLNYSSPISYKEFLALFGVRLYQGKDLRDILENLFVKVVKERGSVTRDCVREMLTVLNVNASEKHVEVCFESVLGGEKENVFKLDQFLKLFGVTKT